MNAADLRGPCLRKQSTPTKNQFEVLADHDDEDDGCFYIDQVNVDPSVVDEYGVAGGYGGIGEKGRGKEHGGVDINWVSEEKECEVVGKGEIIVDSGAAESVCPWRWAEAFPIREIPEGRKRDFRNASGHPMGHYGERRVR